MSKQDYFDNEAISRGDLLKFKESSKKGAFKMKAGNEKADTDDMNFGRAFHSYMELGVDCQDEDVFVIDESERPEPTKDYRTKVNKEWKEDMKAIAMDYDSIVTVEQWKQIVQMATSIHRTEFYKKAFNKVGVVEFEREFYTTINGTKYKCITDVAIEYEDRIIIIDWKTTKNSLDVDNLYTVKKDVYAWDLHVQNVHYKKVVKATTKKEVIFCFMFVEKDAPYEALPLVFGEGSDFDVAGEMIWNRCNANFLEYASGKQISIAEKLNNGILVL